jgi:hypothetical protein
MTEEKNRKGRSLGRETVVGMRRLRRAWGVTIRVMKTA